jgi:hypothetical protein
LLLCLQGGLCYYELTYNWGIRLRSILVFLLLFTISAAASSAPITIDFEEFSIGETGSVESQGFTVSGSYNLGYQSGYQIEPAEILVGPSGTKSFGSYASGWGQDGDGVTASVTVERTDGGVFAMHDFNLWLNADGNGYTNISGIDANGDSVFLQLTWPGTDAWLSLRSVSFEAIGAGFQIGNASAGLDNIVVSNVVPIPAAVWLFGSALAGLGWLRRKQIV